MARFEKQDGDDDVIKVILHKGKRKSEPFVFCDWAAGKWEAQHHANTPAHRRSIERRLKVMAKDPAWYKYRPVEEKIKPKRVNNED